MEHDGALDRLEKKLESRKNGTNVAKTPRSQLQAPPSANMKTEWERPDLSPRPPQKKVTWVTLAFIGSIGFFIIAVVFSAFLFFSGSNTISTRNVDIAVDGPVSIRAGDTITLQVVITNRNTVPMELADLVIEFPSGTRAETDISVELPRLRESLGTIKPGGSVNRTIKAVFFGSADTETKTRITVEYRVPSSNAIFYGEAEYNVAISQSPASIAVGGLNELVSGQETVLTVTVSSNIQDTLKNMLLVVDYPPGFAFSSASPAPFAGEDVWQLGDIEPSGKKIITIRGSFSGEDGDERVVKFETGSEKAGVEGELAAPLAAGEKSVMLTKPFVSASLALGGSVTTEYIAERGKPIRGDVRYTNNLTGRVQDVEVIVTLGGAVLDKSKVTVERGFYNSGANIISWDKQTNQELGNLPAGASGVLTFSIASLPVGQGTFRDPEMTLNVTVRARRVSETNVPETVESKSSARVIVSTDLSLASSIGGTTGPTPPQAEVPTNYTVNWSATNTTNAVANASVSAVLPSYVRWAGSTDSAVSFNAVGGIVTWNIGDLASGQTKNTSFTLTLTPSVSQKGNIVTLMSDQRVYGFDRFARIQIERVLQALTTGEPVQQ